LDPKLCTAPAVIDHTNMAFQSSIEMFIGVNRRSQQVRAFNFFILTLSQLRFAKEGLPNFTPLFCAGSRTL
jgi:hypothetical protein